MPAFHNNGHRSISTEEQGINSTLWLFYDKYVTLHVDLRKWSLRDFHQARHCLFLSVYHPPNGPPIPDTIGSSGDMSITRGITIHHPHHLHQDHIPVKRELNNFDSSRARCTCGKGWVKLVIELNGASRSTFLWNSAKLNQIHQNMLSPMKWDVKNFL